ncbi:ribonuclease P protein component [Dactylosporangium sp. NPDC051484]|uniref:ribonuclease P protein component n=1 Tax=Dactylosporangium sp. NPDC051484 TaxID=3154942 RepID=UPI00344EDED3
MLAAAQRLRRREDFAATIRNGRRAGRGAVVVHFLNPGPSRPGVAPFEPLPTDTSHFASSPEPASSSLPVPSSPGPSTGGGPVLSESHVETSSGDLSSGHEPQLDHPQARHSHTDADHVGAVHAEAEWVEPVAPESGSARAGFVVSKAVGNAVVRNAVKRRLRHLVRARIAALPAGSVLVVRALPEAAGLRYDMLERDLDAALEAARRPKNRGGRR